jgi:hypothetical protein
VKHTLVVRSKEVAARAAEIIKSLPLDDLHEVCIRPHKKDRSAAQNSLLWSWLTIIGAELGESKDAMHERYKEKFLVPIYERDNPDYAETIEAVRNVYRLGAKQEAMKLRTRIILLTSTTTATVAQMTEYLTEIDRHAASLGIRLPRPDDIYDVAMGVRNVRQA